MRYENKNILKNYKANPNPEDNLTQPTLVLGWTYSKYLKVICTQLETPLLWINKIIWSQPWKDWT